MPVDVTLTARVPAESTPVPLALNLPLAEPFLVSVPAEKVKVSMPPSLARTTVVPIAATETPVEDICAARFVSAPSVRSALTTMVSMPDEVARKSWPVPLRVTDTAKFDGDGVAGLVSIADQLLRKDGIRLKLSGQAITAELAGAQSRRETVAADISGCCTDHRPRRWVSRRSPRAHGPLCRPSGTIRVSEKSAFHPCGRDLAEFFKSTRWALF